MKVLVTGANGQLGTDLVKICSSGFEVYGFGRDELDVTNNHQVSVILRDIRPDVVIHAAAYTAVDQAEIDVDQAFSINAFGTRNIATETEAIGAKLCYISTDYVFDGSSSKPYKEYDNTNPVSVYGSSKRAGEELVKSLSSRYFIVRTAWVYGQNGDNFVKTMLKLADSKNTLKVVADQTGSPTYTKDLAKFVSSLIETNQYGIYHATNSGTCTWYEFAREIFQITNKSINVEPCTTDEFPRPAPRPAYSVLDQISIRCNGFETLRHWKDALKDYLNCK